VPALPRPSLVPPPLPPRTFSPNFLDPKSSTKRTCLFHSVAFIAVICVVSFSRDGAGHAAVTSSFYCDQLHLYVYCHISRQIEISQRNQTVPILLPRTLDFVAYFLPSQKGLLKLAKLRRVPTYFDGGGIYPEIPSSSLSPSDFVSRIGVTRRGVCGFGANGGFFYIDFRIT
jgi:hypothetical protein